MSQTLTRLFARNRLNRGFHGLTARYLGRRFSKRGLKRVAIYHTPYRICFSQIYPFLHDEDRFAEKYGVEFRCFEFDRLLAGDTSGLEGADVVLLQPWFTVSLEELEAACAHVTRAAPQAQVSFLDSFAHNDLRLAKALPDSLRYYVKKSLFNDKQAYLKAYRGDTQLTDYYINLYGLEGTPVQFDTPPEIFPKLRVGANFFTAPHLMAGFQAPNPPPQTGRTLDVQTRLGAKGSPWYATMRTKSQEIIDAMPGVVTSPKDRVSMKAYLAEMTQAKLCFSPFGFGELCWRDIEAMMTGAVLIKQNMDHLETLPDLYEPGVTYLPVAWDFSDLDTVIADALANAPQREAIAQTAYERVARYLSQGQFVEDMGFLFQDI